MQDADGLYYYPAPQNKRIRMYVRESFGSVEFRMKNDDYPEVWERHGWRPYEEIEEAAALYKVRRQGSNPLLLYDLAVAKELLAGAKKAQTQ